MIAVLFECPRPWPRLALREIWPCTDLISLIRCQMISDSPKFHVTPAKGRLTPEHTFNMHQVQVHDRSLVESGFKPGIFRRGLTTSPSSTVYDCTDEEEHVKCMKIQTPLHTCGVSLMQIDLK
ncbi:hypothetical protein AVEN_186771-1 [Araneus ventricosus]|uniref:Uncharacterized protein n=1 Tax=Araneus ventricosus TaxID=182803 RepID=A0A4Y2MB93_ARAVE|nr:hypothetical protein AVEN_186771-1 [Araneus ventricosus]